jgi:hypothetical protein
MENLTILSGSMSQKTKPDKSFKYWDIEIVVVVVEIAVIDGRLTPWLASLQFN